MFLKHYVLIFVPLKDFFLVFSLQAEYQIENFLRYPKYGVNNTGFFTVISYRGIRADVIVYIFAHLHTALLTEINKLDMN